MKKQTSLIIFRVFLSLIFIISSIGHIVSPEYISKKLSESTFGFIIYSFLPVNALIIVTGFILLIFGFSFMFGYKTKISATILLLNLIPITFFAQIGGKELIGPLFKNIAIMGGLQFFIFGLDE